MKTLLTIIIAISGLVFALAPAYGVNLANIDATLKVVIGGAAFVVSSLLLLWHLMEITFSRWGVVIDKKDYGEKMIETARNVPHAYVKLRTRWPHFSLEELRITLETPGQPSLETPLVSSDGKRPQYRIETDLGYLNGLRHTALIPIAYRARGNNSVFLGWGNGGKRMLYEEQSQIVRVLLHQGERLLLEGKFHLSLNESGEFVIVGVDPK